MVRKIIIGSRGSDLALWQAHFTQQQLTEIGIETEIKVIKTKGDRIQHLSFDKMEGKGFFTKEIEEALLTKEIDLAVHSHKDLETNTPHGLVIGGVSSREDPAELLLIRKESYDPGRELSLKKNAIVGTSSSRRKAQLLSLQPEVTIKDIRGNVPTRVDKLRQGDFDAILLAYAGVKRLRLIINDLVAIRLDPHIFIPAPAQGVLAYQCREDDQDLLTALASISSAETKTALDVERAVLKGLGGGCQVPFGIHCTESDGKIHGEAVLADDWDSFPRRVHFEGSHSGLDKGQILAGLKEPLTGTVLITRELQKDSYLKRYCRAHGAKLIDQAFISISSLAFTDNEETDWVFFSSPNGVKHYLDQGGQIGKRKIGVYGAGTAKALAAFGMKADFTGHGTDSSKVGNAFKSTVGKSKVLFPGSSITLGSIQSHFEARKAIRLPVYETRLVPQTVRKQIGTGIFTSPSNVEAFLQANPKEGVDQYIALGTVTADALRKHGIEPKVAYLPTEFALASML